MPKSALITNGELVLYGDVGDMWNDGSGFGATDVLNALSEMSGDITVRLNSGGGLAFDGIAIFNALKAYPGKVKVSIDAVAASAASVIAMAGDEIVMKFGALLMIHDPSTFAWGNARALHKAGDLLETLGTQAGKIYCARSGKSMKKVADLMAAETWMTAEDAVDLGFATLAEDEPVDGVNEKALSTMSNRVTAALFDYSKYQHAPASIRAGQRPLPVSTQERTSTMTTTKEAADKAAADAAAAKVTSDAAAAVLAAQSKTVTQPTNIDNRFDIQTRALALGMNAAEANDIVLNANNDMDKAKDLMIAKLHARAPNNDQQQNNPVRTRETVQVGLEARDKFMLGAEKALLRKANMDGGEVNEFFGATLSDLARMALEHSGVRVTGHDRMKMIGSAFMPRMDGGGQASTSDFAQILANVANKSMMKGYMESEETFQKWTATGSLGDFKAAKRVDLNLFPTLAVVPEGGEYTTGFLTDRGVTVQLATYGKLFSITRQAIINDDLNAFTKIPNRMGRASARTVGNLVYAVLTANAAMADTYALFEGAHHKNLAGAGAVLSTASISAGRTAMAKQTDPDAIAVGGLNIRPAFMIVPIELELLAKQYMLSEYDPGATVLASPNIVRGLAEVVSDARLSTASAISWYMAANPNSIDTIEVSYLNGVATPILEQKLGWEVDGVDFKVRLDAGVTALDFRGLYKNPGA